MGVTPSYCIFCTYTIVAVVTKQYKNDQLSGSVDYVPSEQVGSNGRATHMLLLYIPHCPRAHIHSNIK